MLPDALAEPKPLVPALLTKAAVPRLYTWLAPGHDLLAALIASRARRQALSTADVQAGEAVLEVGVGTGLSFREMLRRNPEGRLSGVDLTPAMLRRARRRAARTRHACYDLSLGDAYALDFPDASFDLVLTGYMIDLLPRTDFTRVLRECHRVLRPGGRFVSFHMTHGEKAGERFWMWLSRLHPIFLGGCRSIRLAPLLGDVGFEKVSSAVVRQLGFPSEIVTGTKPTTREGDMAGAGRSFRQNRLPARS